MPVLLRCSFLQPLPLWKITFRPQWPMVAMQPCADPDMIPPPWHHACAHLIIGCYVCGFLKASTHVGNALCPSVSRPSVVHHFSCAIPAIMAPSCSDRRVRERVPVYVASFNILFVLLVIVISYIFIFTTVLKMHSSASSRRPHPPVPPILQSPSSRGHSFSCT